MSYEILSQEEQDEIIVSYLHAQERDEFCHQLNMARFDAMLPSLPAGKFKERIAQLRNDTQERLVEVTGIKTATLAQLPPKERVDAAKARIAAKEAAAKA